MTEEGVLRMTEERAQDDRKGGAQDETKQQKRGLRMRHGLYTSRIRMRLCQSLVSQKITLWQN
ncbi:MAG: hypothetical protein OEZ36_02670 [Spirochaetota bacterium]|nr:hypothetical protein [Spirochaetota bacterium]